MSRPTGFHTRQTASTTAPAKSKGFFAKATAAAAPAPAAATLQPDQHAGYRRQGLVRLIEGTAQGVHGLSKLVNIPADRLQRLADGTEVLEAPLASHIEESVGLTAGWMESETAMPIPISVVSRLIAVEDVSFTSLEDVFATPSVPTSITASPGARMMNDAITSIHQQAEEQGRQPKVFLRRKRTIDPNEVSAAQAELSGTTMESLIETKVETKVDQPASAPLESLPAIKTNVEVARENLRKTLEFFPAMRQFLADHTDLSTSTISGSITGSRGFAERNVPVIEQAFKVMPGWLSVPMLPEQIEADLRASLGDPVIDAPAPRRGRQAGQPAAVKRPKQPMHAEIPMADAGEPHPAAVINDVHERPVPAQPAPAASRTTTQIMGQALIDILQRKIDNNELSDERIAQIMSLVYP